MCNLWRAGLRTLGPSSSTSCRFSARPREVPATLDWQMGRFFILLDLGTNM